MIHSDLHIHSEYSYDSALPLETIVKEAEARGYRQVGVAGVYENKTAGVYVHHKD